MTIAYLLDFFPILSETFIVREILALKRKPFNVLIFARTNTTDHKYSEVIHSDTRKLMKDVKYFSSVAQYPRIKRWALLIRYHFYFLIRNPIRYSKTFLFACHSRKIFLRFIFSVLYAKELINAGVDHIHAHFALESCTNAMLISILTGIPYSFTVHAHDIFIPQLADLLEYKFKKAKFAVCISDYNKQYVLKKFPSVNPERIRTIHCGLDLSDIIVPESKTINRQFTILSIGRLVEHKGFKYLIEACKLLKEHSGIGFVCNIIGDGKDRQALEELISNCNLEKEVNLLGSREQSDVMIALKGADLFVLPCVVEKNGMMDGIPVSLMESMAMGIPVISTKVSGVPELIKDGAGILVEPQDAAELSAAIEKILKLPDIERKEMGRIGRAIIETEFNIEKEVEKLGELVSTQLC